MSVTHDGSPVHAQCERRGRRCAEAAAGGVPPTASATGAERRPDSNPRDADPAGAASGAARLWPVRPGVPCTDGAGRTGISPFTRRRRSLCVAHLVPSTTGRSSDRRRDVRWRPTTGSAATTAAVWRPAISQQCDHFRAVAVSPDAHLGAQQLERRSPVPAIPGRPRQPHAATPVPSDTSRTAVARAWRPISCPPRQLCAIACRDERSASVPGRGPTSGTIHAGPSSATDASYRAPCGHARRPDAVIRCPTASAVPLDALSITTDTVTGSSEHARLRSGGKPCGRITYAARAAGASSVAASDSSRAAALHRWATSIGSGRLHAAPESVSAAYAVCWSTCTGDATAVAASAEGTCAATASARVVGCL